MIAFIAAWLISVITMTLFSILVNVYTKYELREHILLKRIAKASALLPSKPYIGLIIHFCFGLGFMLLFEGLWIITPMDKSLLWAIAIGGLMGFLGILGWKLLFKCYPLFPDINFKLYYIQLFFAHIIFSLTAYGIYQLYN